MSVERRVDTLLQRIVDDGRETGLQVAAYLDGELVIDSWAGLADPATGREADGETLFHVFSAGKGVTATAVHVLAERGLLEYEDLISTHWPEFAANGKEQVTVRHALTHGAGIPQLPDCTSLLDMCNWDKMCETVAALTPSCTRDTSSREALTNDRLSQRCEKSLATAPYRHVSSASTSTEARDRSRETARTWCAWHETTDSPTCSQPLSDQV